MFPPHFLSVTSAVGKGLVVCTKTAVQKTKNNPQSVVHCEQNTPITEEQPSGGNLPKLPKGFTRKKSKNLKSRQNKVKDKKLQLQKMRQISAKMMQLIFQSIDRELVSQNSSN